MLYIGTSRHLEELDEGYTLALDAAVTAIATSASGSSYVLLDGERVARINQLDVSPIAELSGRRAQSMALTARSEILLGLEGASLALLSGEGELSALSSFDHLPGREGWENPGGPTPDLRSLATVGDLWYAAVHVGGLWRSADRGASWTAVVEAAADVHEVAVSENGTVAVAAAGGFGLSTDGGDSWQWTTAGLHAPYARAVALSGETAYLSASTGPRTSDGRLYRAQLGEPFSQCGGELFSSFPFNLETGTLAAASNEVAFGTSSGLAFRSSDRGVSWQQVASEMRPVSFLRFA